MESPKVLKSEKLYAGKVFDLVVDQIEYGSGNRGVREVARHPGGAVVAPFLDNETLLLIRQFRYPMKQVLFELPAGKLDPGEDPQACAQRELREETGYEAGTLQKLTAIYTSPGFCDEQLHLFAGTELRYAGQPKLEEGELGLTVVPTPVSEVLTMMENGTIVDAKTLCAIFLALRKFGWGRERRLRH